MQWKKNKKKPKNSINSYLQTFLSPVHDINLNSNSHSFKIIILAIIDCFPLQHYQWDTACSHRNNYIFLNLKKNLVSISMLLKTIQVQQALLFQISHLPFDKCQLLLQLKSVQIFIYIFSAQQQRLVTQCSHLQIQHNMQSP